MCQDAGGSRTHWMRLCRPPPRRVTSASSSQCPCQESNLVYDLRRVACIHHTPRTMRKIPHRGIEPRPTALKAVMRPPHSQGMQSISRPGIEPGPGPSESPMQSATPSGQSGPTTGFAPACFRLQGGRLSQSSHVGSQHEREDSNPIQRLWRPPALPGARSCKAAEPLRKGLGGDRHSSSSTVQYASLRNLDQLSIRMSCRA